MYKRQWYGPHIDRNHFSSTAPRLLVSLHGTGEIVIESTDVFHIRGTNNSNSIGSTPVQGGKLFPSRDSSDWTPVGGVVNESTSVPVPLIITLTPTAGQQALRARVTTEGTGSLTIVSDWN